MEKGKHKMTPEEMDEFSVKLEKWSATLSDNERTLLKHMVELDRGTTTELPRGRFIEKAAALASGRSSEALRPFNFDSVAHKLDRNYWKLMCW